jgi:sporulation protein YlmC with PRC-barrel domain
MRQVYRYEVFSARGKTIGRVSDVLFAPGQSRVVGFVVARPRLLMLFDRKDRYLALDRVEVRDAALHVSGDRDSWDRAAASRLGFSWDDSVVWSGMPVRTEGGIQLGSVRDGLFDPADGRLAALGLTSGMTADAAVGVRDVPVSLVRGFDGEAVLLSDEAAVIETSGGAAAAAGRSAAVAKDTAGKAAKTAAVYGKAAAKAVSKSGATKKAMGWLRSVSDEFKEGMNEPGKK